MSSAMTPTPHRGQCDVRVSCCGACAVVRVLRAVRRAPNLPPPPFQSTDLRLSPIRGPMRRARARLGPRAGAARRPRTDCVCFIFKN
jgi:hypothetical protein